MYRLFVLDLGNKNIYETILVSLHKDAVIMMLYYLTRHRRLWQYLTGIFYNGHNKCPMEIPARSTSPQHALRMNPRNDIAVLPGGMCATTKNFVTKMGCE